MEKGAEKELDRATPACNFIRIEDKNMKIKIAKDIKIGDKITLETGETKRVTATSNGMYRNSTLIQWKGGWTCQLNTAAITPR